MWGLLVTLPSARPPGPWKTFLEAHAEPRALISGSKFCTVIHKSIVMSDTSDGRRLGDRATHIVDLPALGEN
jgi:hypothetical protein